MASDIPTAFAAGRRDLSTIFGPFHKTNREIESPRVQGKDQDGQDKRMGKRDWRLEIGDEGRRAEKSSTPGEESSASDKEG